MRSLEVARVTDAFKRKRTQSKGWCQNFRFLFQGALSRKMKPEQSSCQSLGASASFLLAVPHSSS